MNPAHRRIWTPRRSWKDGSEAIDVADLSDAIEGPDRRFQGHGPGCRCGDLDCPWYRGEHAAQVYRSASSDQRRRWASDVWDAFRDPTGWAMLEAVRQATRRPRWWRRG